jgi:hypothetical protein
VSEDGKTALPVPEQDHRAGCEEVLSQFGIGLLGSLSRAGLRMGVTVAYFLANALERRPDPMLLVYRHTKVCP